MSDAIAWDLPGPFTMQFTVHETDVDRLGHANNVVYVRWLEDVSWAHIESLGMTWELQMEEGRAMAITRTEIDYLGSANAGEELVMGTWLVDFDGRFRSARRFQLVRCSDGRTIARAISRHACINLKTQRPSRIPQRIIDIMRGALVEDPSVEC